MAMRAPKRVHVSVVGAHRRRNIFSVEFGPHQKEEPDSRCYPTDFRCTQPIFGATQPIFGATQPIRTDIEQPEYIG
jgi:hypothetical protein